jgi:uncharacterized protein YdeI (YjbR/CyaY-like superfamily)
MKCRLIDNPYVDKNFQIEFESIKEIEELKNSLHAMMKYYIMCKEDGEEIAPLIYKITEKPLSSPKKKKNG